MSKYEIMLIIDGELSDVDARLQSNNLLSIFENQDDYLLNIVWNDKLAYQIKKKEIAHRFIVTFCLKDKTLLKKFYNLAALNKVVLRYLVINVEKNYGYKSTINPKKLKNADIKQQKYKKYIDLKNKKINKYKETNF